MVSGRRVVLGAGLLAVMLGVGVGARSQAPMSEQERREYLEKLQQILPADPAFDAWLKKTNSLPPDFNSLPRNNAMPDPLKFMDGRTVTTAAQWPARREEILKLTEKYVWGTVPPKPKIDHVALLDEKHEDGYTVRNVRLEFGPGSKGTMRVRVYIPDGDGPFPVMISPNLAGWATSLVRRGYISVGYAGNDAMDDAAALADLYPDYDFALLPRRGVVRGDRDRLPGDAAARGHAAHRHLRVFARRQDGDDRGDSG